MLLKRLGRKILVGACYLLCPLLALLLFLHFFMVSSNRNYLENHISYNFAQTPSQIYEYDAFDEGRDYDALRIYRVSEADSLGLRFYFQSNPDWQPLPLPEDALTQNLCNPQYDPQMPQMLQSRRAIGIVTGSMMRASEVCGCSTRRPAGSMCARSAASY